MPIYEYQCSKCGEIFEAFQKMTDRPLGRCKFCQGRVEKLISQSSFQLKGTGWYLTDYAGKSKKSEASSSPESRSSSKSEKAESGGGSKTSGADKSPS